MINVLIRASLLALAKSIYLLLFQRYFFITCELWVVGQRHFWAFNFSLPPHTIFLQPENHFSLFDLKRPICCDVLCIRQLDVRSHLKLNLYFFEKQ